MVFSLLDQIVHKKTTKDAPKTAMVKEIAILYLDYVEIVSLDILEKHAIHAKINLIARNISSLKDFVQPLALILIL